MGVGVVQLVAVLASSAVKKGIGPEIAPILALGVGQGVVGPGAPAMGAQQEDMEVHKGLEGAMVEALLLHLGPVTNVDSLDIGQRIAHTDECKHVEESLVLCLAQERAGSVD